MSAIVPIQTTDDPSTAQQKDGQIGGKHLSIPYVPEIDGLRAIAVAVVLVFHLDPRYLPGGFVGVDIFFVISGYLITAILLGQLALSHCDLVGFYQRRIARLAPMMVLVAGATVIASALLYEAQDIALVGTMAAAAALSLTNFKLMLQGSYFKVPPDAQPLLHYWSLAVEEQFYFVWPVLLKLGYRYFRPRLDLSMLVGAAGSFLVCLLLTSYWPTGAFYLPMSRAWEFLIGALLAIYAPQGNTKAVAVALRCSGLLLIIGSVFLLSEKSTFPGYVAMIPVAGTGLILRSLGGEPRWPSSWLGSQPLVALGKLSYTLYLVHWPVFSLLDYLLVRQSAGFRLSWKVLVTAVISWVAHLIVEVPARAFLARRSSRGLCFAAAVAGLVVLAAGGFYVRRVNYLDASPELVASGGMRFSPVSARARIVLFGDSEGSSYAKMIREISAELNLELTILSVAGSDPLPGPGSQDRPIWRDTLTAISRLKPELVVVACAWGPKLQDEPDRALRMVTELSRYTGKIIVLTEPPSIPENATREGLRRMPGPGPFFEPAAERAVRERAEAYLRAIRSDSLIVIPVSRFLLERNGGLRLFAQNGHPTYHDTTHLSYTGTSLVRTTISDEILKTLEVSAKVTSN